MDNTEIVEIRYCLENVRHNDRGLVFFEKFLFLDIVVKISIHHILCYNVDGSLRLELVKESHNIWVMAQF